MLGDVGDGCLQDPPPVRYPDVYTTAVAVPKVLRATIRCSPPGGSAAVSAPSTPLRSPGSSVPRAGPSRWPGCWTRRGSGRPTPRSSALYADPSAGTASLIWVQVLVFATIAFLWFVGVVRGRLGDREPKLFGTVFFGASILLAGLLFVGASFLVAPAVLVSVGARAPDPERWRSPAPRPPWCCRCSPPGWPRW